MMLSGNLCNFQMLSWNNLAIPSTEVFSIVDIKCAIFVILLHTTNILSYPCASSNFVIKSTDICVQGFSSTVFSINFPAGASIWFLFLWHTLHPSTYFLTSFVTPGRQKFLVTNSVIFHYPSCPPMLWLDKTAKLFSIFIFYFLFFYLVKSLL